MDLEKIKIGFVSPHDPTNITSWSGTLYFMFHAIEKHGDVVWLQHNGLLEKIFLHIVWRINKVTRMLGFGSYAWTQSTFLAYLYGKKITKNILKHKPDIIFGAVASIQLSFVETDIPIIYTSDTTYEAMRKIYTNPHKKEFWNIVGLESRFNERRTVERANLITLPLKWAINSSIEDYNLSESKIFQHYWGSNLRTINRVPATKKSTTVCKILFLGIDWYRKGGDIVVETCKELLKEGIEIELTVCGCRVPKEYQESFIHNIEFLNKNNPEEEKELLDLFSNSHFLFMPSRGECVGMVYLEASSLGIPSIARDIGGTSCSVTEKNGVMLDVEALPQDYAKAIKTLFKDKDTYVSLSQSCIEEYESKYNWETWAEELFKTIKEEKLLS